MRDGLHEEAHTVEAVGAVERAVWPLLAEFPVEDGFAAADQVLAVIGDAGDHRVDRITLLLDEPVVLRSLLPALVERPLCTVRRHLVGHLVRLGVGGRAQEAACLKRRGRRGHPVARMA